MILKDCTRCLVFSPNGDRLSEARVVVAGENVTLFFDSNHVRDMKIKSRVNFFDEQIGLVRTVCLVKIHRNPAYPDIREPWSADCKILEVMNVVQRQQDIRVRVDLGATFRTLKHGSFYGVIENLSAGGMYLTTSQPLERNETVEFDYRFRSVTRHFVMSTLWVKRLPGGKYGYGCQFHNLTSGAESAIREFVFKKQKEKNKNL